MTNYDTGHPWYYRQRGKLMFLKDIKREAESEPITERDEWRLRKFHELKNPEKRRATLDQLERDTWAELWERDFPCYRQCRRNMALIYKGLLDAESFDQWNEPHTAIGLKFNHIFNGFRALHQIRQARAAVPQMDFFAAQSEPHDTGAETVDQFLINGVPPVTQADKDTHTIKTRSERPLRSSQAQKPCTVGLWDDEKRNQLDLF